MARLWGIFVLLVCWAAICVVHARPRKDSEKQEDEEQLSNLKKDVEWESKWWTPSEKKDSKDTKDGWKIFKNTKPSVRRWWEEDWHEDEWWSPKDQNSKPVNTVSSSKTKDAGKSDLLTSGKQAQSADSSFLEKEKQQEEGKKDLAPEPVALPLSGKSQNLVSGSEVHTEKGKKSVMPAAESPREKLNPALQDSVSPFEDPKPGPYAGPRDELPADEKWEYHQQASLAKYVDHSLEKLPDQNAADQKQMGSDEMDEAMRAKIEAEIQREEDKSVVKIAEEDKTKVLDQFYGFGLESGAPARPASPKTEKIQKQNPTSSKTEEVKKQVDVAVNEKPAKPKPGKENYNEGVIYDTIPGAPLDRTHSVKKDLSSSEYMKNFVGTKSDLQTSPNPAPPGIASKQATSEDTTPRVQMKDAEGAANAIKLVKKAKSSYSKSAASSQDGNYIKSSPLTLCKYDGECRNGRMCQDGMCVCLPENGCSGHYKPVCGSDGVQYTSHCELHRTACVKGVHIKIDHSGSCMVKHDKIDTMRKVQDLQKQQHQLNFDLSDSDDTDDSDSEDDDSDDDEEEEEDDDGDLDNESDSDDDDDSDYDSDDSDYDSDDDDDSEELDDDSYDDDSDSDSDSDDSDSESWEEKDSGVPKNSVIDSKKIYDYSKHLKESKQKADESTESSAPAPAPAPWDHVQEETGDEFPSKKDEKAESKGDYQQDMGYKECSEEELAKYKEELLAFHCKLFDEPDCKLELREEREYLSTLMFSYFDKNTDYELDYQELEAKQKQGKLSQMSSVCSLIDLIWNDDTMNYDGQLSLDEFIAAFNRRPLSESELQPMKTSKGLVTPVVHVIPTLATAGNGLELKCGLAVEGANVVWRRHGVNIHDLAMTELLVLDDGSLFFSKMGVHHMGNYTCEDASSPSVLQVHSLKVQMPPVVRVSRHSLIQPSQLDVSVRCHAEGVPKPTITWQKNNKDLPPHSKHYRLKNNQEILTVHLTDSDQDTGAYKCMAKNQAGTAEDITTLFVEPQNVLSDWYGNGAVGTFAVFHAKGITAYNPILCLQQSSVHGDFGYFKFIPDNLDAPLRLCEEGRGCQWGDVVNVKNSFVFVSQPDMNRVVVVETTKNWIPVQVIATDKRPMQLHYVEHMDQVWVLCWNGDVDESTKTIVVVRDASKSVQHRSVHTQPVGNHFDQVQDLFIAPPNDLHHAFNYGYVTHNGQRGLTKLDLDNMRYVKTVDLSTYDCVPHSLAFVPIGGHVVVQCVSPLNHQTLQIIMDYITDAVISTAVLPGKPYVSPDSRHVVTVDNFTGKVSVAGVSDEGVLEQAYEVTVSTSISDVSFFPLSGHGYMLVLTSADDDNIITISLATGKVEKLKGTKKQETSSDWHPSPVQRTIVSGDFFSDLLLAPSKSSISIMNIKYREVQCEFTDSPPSMAAVFVGLQ